VTDEEYVAAVQEGLRVTRERIAELNAAAQKAIELDPISDLVVATFDADGFLVDLFIDPTALTSYDHTELEDLITEVLRDGNSRLREVVLETFDHYFSAGSPWHDLKALADEW
jgi:DNA-binding protein YbaB